MAKEMKSGVSRKMNFWEMLKKAVKVEDGALGNLYMKFLEPIDLQKFIEEEKGEQMSTVLTNRLLKA